MCDIVDLAMEGAAISEFSDLSMEAAKKIIEPSEKIKEKIINIFKPKPIFVSTPKKCGIDWGEIADLKSFNDEIVKNSDVTKLSAEAYEEKLFRFALKFRTREVWVYTEIERGDGKITTYFLFYPSKNNLIEDEGICYNFDRIIFMKRSDFRKIPKTRNFSLVLKYRKTMRKILGVK